MKKTELEEEASKKASKGKFGLALPGSKKVSNIFSKIGDFFTTLMWGQIALFLLKHADVIGKWLPNAGKWVDGIIDGFVGFIDRIVDAVDQGKSFTDWLADEVATHFGGD